VPFPFLLDAGPMFYLGRSISLLVFGLIFQLGLDLTTEIFKDLTTLIIHPLTPDDMQYPSIFEHYYCASC
jgi:hypothetical protein